MAPQGFVWWRPPRVRSVSALPVRERPAKSHAARSGSAKGFTRYATGARRREPASGSSMLAQTIGVCAVHRPESLRTLDTGCVGGLEEDHVDRRRLGGFEHGSWPMPDHDAAEKLANLGMRLADQDPSPHLILGGAANLGCIWYGTGMKRARVLVVDDDADIRGLVTGAARARRLRGGGKPERAGGAAHALLEISRSRPARRLHAGARRLADARAHPGRERHARWSCSPPVRPSWRRFAG